MSTAPLVSVILPCYRGEPLARRAVAELRPVLERLASWEVVVVDDGGGDFGAEWDGDGPVRVVRLAANRGKGAAVCAGMAAARGQARVYTDVDVPYDPGLVLVAADYILRRGFHVVVGDRTLPGSAYRESVTLARRVASALGSTFVGRLVTGGFFDTQCGFKAVRGDVADAMFPLLKVERFAFDVELIYLSLLHRLDVKRIPVRLRRNETSSVRVLRDSSRACFDVLRIKYHQLRGAYASRALHALVEREFRAAEADVHAREAGVGLDEPSPALWSAGSTASWR
jgi:glycosyltransferase involved in cell wall biosynthesis